MPKRYISEFTFRAQSAYDRLPKTLQSRVDSFLIDTERLGLRQRNIHKISGTDRIYLFRLTDQIRIVFQEEDEVIRILDIVSRNQLNRLSRYWSE